MQRSGSPLNSQNKMPFNDCLKTIDWFQLLTSEEQRESLRFISIGDNSRTLVSTYNNTKIILDNSIAKTKFRFWFFIDLASNHGDLCMITETYSIFFSNLDVQSKSGDLRFQEEN